MITLQFSTQCGWQSGTIRWASWCDYSHVDCVMPDGRLLGARSKPDGAPRAGVWIREPNYGKFTKVLQVDYEVHGKEERYYGWLKTQIGKPYDKLDIIDFVAHRFRERNWRDAGAWICSEVQARASEIITESFLMMRIINPYKIDPRDLLLSQSIRGWRVLVG